VQIPVQAGTKAQETSRITGFRKTRRTIALTDALQTGYRASVSAGSEKTTTTGSKHQSQSWYPESTCYLVNFIVCGKAAKLQFGILQLTVIDNFKCPSGPGDQSDFNIRM
jgi:hypothetical protein